MSRRTLGQVRDRSGDTPKRSGMGRAILGEVWDVSGDPRGGPGQDEGPSQRSVGSGDPRGGPVWVGGPSGRSGTGRGTLEEVRDRSGDPRGGS